MTVGLNLHHKTELHNAVGVETANYHKLDYEKDDSKTDDVGKDG